MAYITQSLNTSNDLGGSWFAGRIASLKTWIKREQVFLRTKNELSEMTDRELADIGLTRFQIRDVALDAAARV
jgi:uncharacterized protein YjiS (DUF1127 family)